MLNHIEHEHQIKLMRNQINNCLYDVSLTRKTLLCNLPRMNGQFHAETFPTQARCEIEVCAIAAPHIKNRQSLLPLKLL